MEPIGAAASLVTLIDVVFKTFKKINSLINGYQNAPMEMKALWHRMDTLSSHLQLLRRLQLAVSREPIALKLEPHDLQILDRSLSATSATFSEIHTFLVNNITREGTSARLRWALTDAKKVQVWQRRLQQYADDLQTTLALLNRFDCSVARYSGC